MLETLHRHIDHHVPIYGMNRGTVGFLMNVYSEDGSVASGSTGPRPYACIR